MSGDALSATTAQLPDFDNSDDKIFTTDNAVIVLDGASAFRPVPVPASTYADQLGNALHRILERQPEADLVTVLTRAIAETAERFALVAGHAPMSTVAILRVRGSEVDTLALGDTPIVLPTEIIVDERLDALNLAERTEYRKRLTRGNGYDEQHRALLRRLQESQVPYRNRPGGYWIAEADPQSAQHAYISTHHHTEVPWAVIATDGAYNTLEHLGRHDWESVASYSTHELHELLTDAQGWEAHTDPNGKQLPRSKRHDDKAIAAMRLS